MCEKNHSCCDHKYWDRAEDVEQEAKECGHLIEVEPVRHGEWRREYKRSGSYTVEVECSHCDAVFEISEFSLGLNYNFCPNCGAKMDGGAGHD